MTKTHRDALKKSQVSRVSFAPECAHKKYVACPPDDVSAANLGSFAVRYRSDSCLL